MNDMLLLLFSFFFSQNVTHVAPPRRALGPASICLNREGRGNSLKTGYTVVHKSHIGNILVLILSIYVYDPTLSPQEAFRWVEAYQKRNVRGPVWGHITYEDGATIYGGCKYGPTSRFMLVSIWFWIGSCIPLFKIKILSPSVAYQSISHWRHIADDVLLIFYFEWDSFWMVNITICGPYN